MPPFYQKNIMRYYYNYLIKDIVLCLILLGVILVLPSSGRAGLKIGLKKVSINEQIDISLREEIRLINEKVISLLRKKDASALLELSIDELREGKDASANFHNMLMVIPDEALQANYSVYDEFYWMNEGIGFGMAPFIMTKMPDREYTLSGGTKSDYLYASLLRTTSLGKDALLAIIYSNDGEGWKIHHFSFGTIEIGGKTALEWYDEVLRDYEAGNFNPALMKLYILGEILRPAPFFQYSNEGEMVSTMERIHREANNKYTFPIEVNDIKSRASIFSIKGQYFKGEAIAAVSYVTSLGFADAKLIEAEAHDLAPIIEQNFPGIAGKGKAIFFKAYTELPARGKRTKVYGTMLETK